MIGKLSEYIAGCNYYMYNRQLGNITYIISCYLYDTLQVVVLQRERANSCFYQPAQVISGFLWIYNKQLVIIAGDETSTAGRWSYERDM